MSVRTVTIEIEGITSYAPSRPHGLSKEGKETHEDFDARIWREKIHTDEDGNVFHPADGLKMAMCRAASLEAEKVPGKGMVRYSTLLKSGIVPETNIILNVKKEDAVLERKYVSATGSATGKGSRVWRHFPLFKEWGGTITLSVIDDSIPLDVIEKYAKHAGMLVGIGRARPENGGSYGRFVVTGIKSETSDL